MLFVAIFTDSNFFFDSVFRQRTRLCGTFATKDLATSSAMVLSREIKNMRTLLCLRSYLEKIRRWRFCWLLMNSWRLFSLKKFGSFEHFLKRKFMFGRLSLFIQGHFEESPRDVPLKCLDPLTFSCCIIYLFKLSHVAF